MVFYGKYKYAATQMVFDTLWLLGVCWGDGLDLCH